MRLPRPRPSRPIGRWLDCPPPLPAATKVEVTTHTFTGGEQPREISLSALECRNMKLVADEYQRFNRAGSSFFGFYLIDHARGRAVNRKGLSAFLKAINRKAV